MVQAALLQAFAQVLVNVAGADLGVQCVRHEAIPAVVLPDLAPGAVQHAELELAVLDDGVQVLWDQLTDLAALVHADVVGVGVINRHVDRVLGVGAERQRHAGEFVAQHVDAILALAAVGILLGFQPLVRLLGRRRLNVQRDERRVFELGRSQTLVDGVVVVSSDQRLGAVKATQSGHLILATHPLCDHAGAKVPRLPASVDVLVHQARDAPAGGDKVLGVDDLLQALQVSDVFSKGVQGSVLDVALKLVQPVKAKDSDKVTPGSVAEALGSGNLVGGVAHQRLVQADVLVREGAIRVLVELSEAPDIGVLIDQHGQVAVAGGDDVALTP